MAQKLDSEDWSAICFEDREFPQSLMAISVLDTAERLSPATSEWVWHLTLSAGILKTGGSGWCHDSASELLSLLKTRRAAVLETITERLSPHGFDAALTLSEWTESLQRIREIAGSMNGECSWIAGLP